MSAPEETYSNVGPQCPHCAHQFTADEPHHYDETNYTEDDCSQCGKKFSVSVHMSVSWTCEAIPDPVSSPILSRQSGGE